MSVVASVLLTVPMWAGAQGAAPAGMVSPQLDKPGEPFSYFSKPSDEIGMMDAEAATEITPEGYLRTGFAELMWFTGPGTGEAIGQELEPVSARIRTLEAGHLPIDHYSVTRNGIRYEFTAFAATLDGRAADEPGARLVNFVRVRMINENKIPTRAIFAAAVRYDAEHNAAGKLHGDFRFDRPVEGRFPGDYRQIGEKFNPGWVYGFEDSADAKAGRFLRDGKLIYDFPKTPAPALSLTIYQRYNYPPDLKARALTIFPTTPVGIARYSPMLAPGEAQQLDFKMPVVPTENAAAMAAIDDASFDQAKVRITNFWQKTLAAGMQISLPERKPVDTYDASLVYDLIARDHLGANYIQTVNKLHYHSFYLRDGADIVHMYDVTGYPVIARQVLDFFAQSQKADGNFLSQPEQYDGWGEAVWGYAQHYRMTRDKAFAEDVLPRIDRAVDWLKTARANDPLHIMPASNVLDNEYIPGHLTGYNFLALSGLKLAIAMAVETGHADLAAKWQTEYDSYRTDFLAVLDKQAEANHGYIPPALDGNMGGQDWGNLLAVTPEPTLDAHDPRVTATLKATQAKYQEGIMTYGDGYFLHHYLTIKNTLTEVVRGDQEQATRELYGLLLHTSSTQAGFEFAIRPWGSRDFQDNLSPHGWFAADYRTLLRQMLVREDGDSLHLLSVVSPAWIGTAKTISVEQAPTAFGTVAFTLTQPDAGSAVLRLQTKFHDAPKALVLHLPWFMTVSRATADGVAIQAADGALTLPAGTHEVRLQWIRKANTPALSYDAAVSDYKTEYARRYQEWMHGTAK